MKKIFACLALLIFVSSNAQQPFTLTPYTENIIKVTATPRSGWHNENVSDAVISKPKKLKASFSTTWQNNSVVINDKIHISIFDSAEYRGFAIQLQPDEKIFGAGERAIPLNRRGYRLNLYNNPWYGYSEGADNLNYSVPFITSSNGYALFFDNPSKGFLDIGKTKADVLNYGAVSEEINVYVIFGDYQKILQSYHTLTGTQPLPPKWALGNLMSRFGYTSEAQVKNILGKMKAQNIPVDAIIFDLFWFGDSIKGTMGNLDWVNKNKWPDPRKMIAGFKKQNIHTILVTEPFFVETSSNYKASLPYLAVDSTGKPYYLTDFYFGKGGLIDIFRKDAQQWFWKFYKKQMLNGVEAWWGDLGEPEKHPANLYHNMKDFGHKRLFKADEVHNIYGHNWTKMLYRFYAKEFPGKRLFSLNRSGFAGSQRYSIFPWTGDVSRSWSGYRAQLPTLLGMSMSGVPYVHSDAGGFAGGEGDNELYVRWLQFAAFTPIFRPHGTALYEVDPAAFSFPSEAALIPEPYRSYAKKAIQLRYQFLPYNYSLAYQQTINGKPLIAPLYYHFSNDTTAVKVEDQYMWGENVLVAPVLQKGATTRNLYLPEGQWMDFFQYKILRGKQWYSDSVSLDKFPLFIREGGIISMGSPFVQNTVERSAEPQGILYFVSDKPSSFHVYDDDGKSANAIEAKNYQLLHVSSSGLKNNVLIFELKKEGKRNKSEKYLLMIAGLSGKPKSVVINNKMQNNIQFIRNVKGGNANLLTVPVTSGKETLYIKLIW